MTIGSSLGPYRVTRLLGQGGMGEVWLADDTRLHRQVALKTVRSADVVDTHGRERLLREATAAAALTHHGIAAVYDVLDADGQIVIVFEFVEGESLHARLKQGPLPVRDAVDIAIAIADALDAAHRRGVIHRDLKPANVIIGLDGQPKVLDFGVARVLPSGTTVTATAHEMAGELVGTPGYSAPEQWVSPHADARADLYALGVTLFEMIAGERPFPGRDPIALAEAMLSREAPRLAATAVGTPVPRALDDLVAALLARDRDARPPSASAVLGALQSIRASLTVRPPAWSRAALAVSALLLAIVVGLVGWLQGSRPTGEADPVTPPVVAVLPLNNLSGDSSREYIAAGVADSLITSLATLPSVTVLSRAAVAEARAQAPDLRALARELGASFIVEGSVQQAGDRLQIALTLSRAADRSIVWAETIEGSFPQVLDLQRRLSRALTGALSVRLSMADRERLARAPTASPEALDAYWRGRTLFERLDVRGNIEAAISAFHDAVRLDPRFALAHAALGQCYWQRYQETRDASWVEQAVAAGHTALRLDPDQPEVRYTLAITLAGSGRADEAVDELNRALALRPNYDDARRQLGQVLAQQGRFDEAIVEFQKAIDLRPGIAATYRRFGEALLNAARYGEAAEAFRQMTILQPDNYIGYQLLGAAHQYLGEHDAALRYYGRANEIRPNAQSYSNIGAIHHGRGEFLQAIDAYQHALSLRPNSHQTWRNLGDAYRSLRRRHEAVQAYRRAAEQASSDVSVNPHDATTLAALALYHAKAGDDADALAVLARAEALPSSDGRVLFRAAAVHALAGRRADAIRALTEAVARGYSRSEIASEDDFTSLRGMEEFQALLAPQAKE